MCLRRRNDVGVAVGSAARRDVDDASDPRPATVLEQRQRAEYVDGGVGHRIGDGAGHRDLCRRVNHDLRVDRLDESVELRVANVHHAKRRLAMSELTSAADQAVDDRQLVPGADQLIDDVRPDETGTAGDQNVHALISSIMPSRRSVRLCLRSIF